MNNDHCLSYYPQNYNSFDHMLDQYYVPIETKYDVHSFAQYECDNYYTPTSCSYQYIKRGNYSGTSHYY